MAGDTETVSIEQMNKVRASLGLAPLPVPGNASGPQFKENSDDDSESDQSDDFSTLDKRQAAAGSNWQKLEAEKQEKLEREKRKNAAKKARETAARFQQLQGKGLGDADEREDLDTRTWLLQQKKRQKKIEKARKLEQELAAREQQAEYTAKDLAGVKVGHEAAEFDEMSGEQVLTLKDARIGDESEEDELENAELRAKDKLEEKLRLKKKRPDYDPTEQDEKQNILSKYDEEIDGAKKKRFVLDGQGISAQAKEKRSQENLSSKKVVKINLDIIKVEAPISDYIDPSTIKVKKPKKSKKEKKSRQKTAEDDDIVPVASQSRPAPSGDAMDVDSAGQDASGENKKRAFDLDDEDLQAKLADQRRQALKKRKRTDAAELARQMREEMPVDESEAEEGGLTIDETSEFVANLQLPDPEDEKPVVPRRSRSAEADLDGDIIMDPVVDSIRREEADQITHPDPESEEAAGPADLTTTGLEDEGSMTGGVAATIAMLRRRGVVDDYVENDDRTEAERKRARFLLDKQHLIDEYDQRAKMQREKDRRDGRFDNMTNREREGLARQQNDAREQFIAKLLAEKFTKEYRPNVELRYNDEFGREMNQKEAFKHLSHKFHGKGSGKQKTEKHLKKVEDERKNMAKGLLNVGNEKGMANVQGREGKRLKSAGVRLQ